MMKDKVIYSVIVIFIGIILAYMFFNDNKNSNLIIDATQKSTVEENLVQKAYISGEVINPGVYDIDDNFRVVDLVNLAGGFTNEAYTDNINLSAHVNDADHFQVYSINDMENNIEAGSNFININTATKEELMKLKGIGETISEAIIAYRQENGRFNSIEEIKEVNRIGQSTFENIKNDITVN